MASRALVPVLVVAACDFEPGVVASDASPIDAAARNDASDVMDGSFNPAADCPVDYAVSLSPSTSRYRVITSLATVWAHEADCVDDLAGATHLVSLTTMEEVMSLEAHLDATQTLDRNYVGGVQDPVASVRDVGWVAFDGTDLLQTAWHTSENEPDDLNTDLIENHEQQVLILDRVLVYLHDAIGGSLYGTVCECDGAPVHATARSFFDNDPNNPN